MAEKSENRELADAVRTQPADASRRPTRSGALAGLSQLRRESQMD
jgi:hypothetical protein